MYTRRLKPALVPIIGVASRIAIALVLACSATVLAGWIFHDRRLTQFGVGFVPMSVPTAVAFAFSGFAASTLNLKNRNSRFAVTPRIVCSLVALAIGLFTLADYALNANLNATKVDTSVGYIFGRGTGRIAPATGTDFVILSIVLLLGGGKRAGKIAAIIAAIGLTISSLDLVGYTYGVTSLYKVMPFSAMALPTTICFELLFCSALLMRPLDGWTARILSNDTGGEAARGVLPAVILSPFIFSWLMVQAVNRKLFDPPFGFALVTVATVLVVLIIIVRVADKLGRRDAELRHEVALRAEAENKTRMQLRRMSLLNEITRAISARQDLASIYQVTVRALEDQLPVDFACVLRYDEATNALFFANVGVKGKAFAGGAKLAVLAADELAACVAGSLTYLPNIASAESPLLHELARGGLHSVVSSPLVFEGHVFALLVAGRINSDDFASGDCEFLQQLGEHLELAVNQTKLHQSLQEAYDDLKQSQQAVMQQERLRVIGQMASGVAHDINNAITPLSVYTARLLEGKEDLSPQIVRYLDIATRVTDDVAATVARMREFYRERGAQSELVPVDLNQLADQVIELARARWSDIPLRSGVVIEMRREFCKDLPPVKAIESEIREALTNLIFNAADAMPQGGALTVATRISNDGKVVLEVRDTGLGMDETTRRRCIEPFFTTKGERGTGLGLAMVHGVAQRHDARLEIDSAPGKGTTFRLIFARAEAADSAVLAQAVPPRVLPMRILIVDDDPLVLEVMQAELRSSGHTVIAANGGKEGVEAFRETLGSATPIDVVITDLGMPHMDGQKVARAIKQMSPSTPVILLSGWGRKLGADDGGVIPFDFTLSKPPRLPELRATLAQCAALLMRKSA